MVYRLAGRSSFSRLWRRRKKYSDHEIGWLAKRRRLTVETHGTRIEVTDPVRKKVVAVFNEVAENKDRDEKTSIKIQAYAALKLHVQSRPAAGLLADVGRVVQDFCGL